MFGYEATDTLKVLEEMWVIYRNLSVNHNKRVFLASNRQI